MGYHRRRPTWRVGNVRQACPTALRRCISTGTQLSGLTPRKVMSGGCASGRRVTGPAALVSVFRVESYVDKAGHICASYDTTLALTCLAGFGPTRRRRRRA